MEFRNIEAATFGIVGEDEDAPTIALPVLGTSMDWKNSLQVGVRFEIPRSERKKIKPEDLYTEITKALSLGLARAADALLLSAINAAMPDTFSLAKAASRGLRFDELRALVGSAGHGATVNEDGALRVAGIAAELTPDMAETLVGSFNRAGVVVDSEVTVLFERLQKNGHLACTAWASMIPLVPDGSAFWTVT